MGPGVYTWVFNLNIHDGSEDTITSSILVNTRAHEVYQYSHQHLGYVPSQIPLVSDLDRSMSVLFVRQADNPHSIGAKL
jgi:hypothetical protein